MKNKKYIILWIVLVTIGSLYSVYSAPVGGFCIWGRSCDDGNLREDLIWVQLVEINFIYPGNNSLYEFREEGVVANVAPYEKAFFDTLEKVIKVSISEYNKTIQEIVNEGSFEEIYSNYSILFNINYSLEIDNQFERDYIQNIGELISNKYHGDCDDYAVWLYLIAKEKGLEVRYVIGFRLYGGHAWIQIKVDGEWIDYNSTSYLKGKGVVSKDYSEIYYYEDEENE